MSPVGAGGQERERDGYIDGYVRDQRVIGWHGRVPESLYLLLCILRVPARHVVSRIDVPLERKLFSAGELRYDK
jgi:hypothetical protein